MGKKIKIDFFTSIFKLANDLLVPIKKVKDLKIITNFMKVVPLLESLKKNKNFNKSLSERMVYRPKHKIF